MIANIIRIGNSNGIRLNKTILQQYGIKGKVELVFEKDHIKIIPIDQPRIGWENQFKLMAENNDDDLLIDDVFEDENIDL